MSAPQHPRQPCGLPTPQSTASFWHSEPSPLLIGHRTTRGLPRTADVVIIGSGITGASIAHHLLSDQQTHESLDVVMLEAREACWGATGRNGGHCQATFITNALDPSVGFFEMANFNTIQGLVNSRAIDCEFVPAPSVHAFYTTPRWELVNQAFDKIASDVPELASKMYLVTDLDELRELRVPTAIGALVCEGAARMWPYKFVARILEDLLSAAELPGSFNLQTLTPVNQVISLSDGVSVVTQRGVIKAKKVALATNAYTSHLLPELTSLIVPCRGQMSALIPPPSLKGDHRLQHTYGFNDDHGMDDYLVQRPSDRGEHLMFGGGAKPGHFLDEINDGEIDESTSHYLRTKLFEDFKSRETISSLPRQDHEIMKAPYIWTGVMGYSRDVRPWIGPVPERAHLYVAAGYNGHGMPNTWLCGRAVAVMMTESFKGAHEPSQIEAARNATGLPAAYLITSERIKKARRLPDLAESNLNQGLTLDNLQYAS